MTSKKFQAQDTVHFPCGKTMKNRFALAPMTNKQSHADGQLSDEELHWLEMRAKGQFGMVITCASHVQPNGQGWVGELGIFSDELIAGHQRLTKAIQAEGSLAVIQIFHGGMRAPKKVTGVMSVCPSDNEKHEARAMSLEEVHEVRDNFIAAAVRAQKAGYDGIQIHGAHGYLVAQFLSADINKREDEYGGSLENRARLLFEIVDGIRAACGKEFLLSVRLSPERFGMQLEEIKTICKQLIDGAKVDLLDLSLWDCFKKLAGHPDGEKTLLADLLEMDFKDVILTVAGKIDGASEVKAILDQGVDIVSMGKSGILHHDFPVKVMNDASFRPASLPVTAQHLTNEGLSPKFIDYMRAWKGFVQD